MKDFLAVLRLGGLAGGGIVYLIYMISSPLFFAGVRAPLFVWAALGILAVYLFCYGIMSCDIFASRIRYLGMIGVAVVNAAGAVLIARIIHNGLCPGIPVLMLSTAVFAVYTAICWPWLVRSKAEEAA